MILTALLVACRCSNVRAAVRHLHAYTMQDQVIAELEQGEAGPSRPSQSAPADADKATERVKADVSPLQCCGQTACQHLT